MSFDEWLSSHPIGIKSEDFLNLLSRDAWQASREEAEKEIEKLKENNKALEKQLSDAREIIEFYANTASWNYGFMDSDNHNRITEDDIWHDKPYHGEGHHDRYGGKRAREALRKLEELKSDSNK